MALLTNSLLTSLLPLLGTCAVTTSFAGLLGGSTCIWYACSDNDDEFDDDCDDDDDFDRSDTPGVVILLPRPAGGWVLEDVETEMRHESGRWSVGHVTVHGGPNLAQLRPSGRFGADELREFCREILKANEDLLGLPEDLGFLVAGEVFFEPSAIRVVFDQYEEPAEGYPLKLGGRGLVFSLDTLGTLREVEVFTWLGH